MNRTGEAQHGVAVSRQVSRHAAPHDPETDDADGVMCAHGHYYKVLHGIRLGRWWKGREVRDGALSQRGKGMGGYTTGVQGQVSSCELCVGSSALTR